MKYTQASFDHQTQSRVLQKRIQDLETVVEAQKHERNVLMNDNHELKASKDAAIRDLEGRNADLAHELHNERESLANVRLGILPEVPDVADASHLGHGHHSWAPSPRFGRKRVSRRVSI